MSILSGKCEQKPMPSKRSIEVEAFHAGPTRRPAARRGPSRVGRHSSTGRRFAGFWADLFPGEIAGEQSGSDDYARTPGAGGARMGVKTGVKVRRAKVAKKRGRTKQGFGRVDSLAVDAVPSTKNY